MRQDDINKLNVAPPIKPWQSETFDRNDESVNEIASRETLKKLDAIIDAVGKPEIISSGLPRGN